jgi:methylated-DNA-[protein]-cysteine S-methyltransferase
MHFRARRSLSMNAVNGTDGFAFFDTALGRCGIAWGALGLLAVNLPEADAAVVRARLLRRRPGLQPAEPPPEVQQAIEGIRALLRGERTDLSSVPLDMRGLPELHRRVYDIARRIPAGATLSYGQIARQLGDLALARAVGQALGRNPFAPVVPCHRVLAAGGKPGGFSAQGGLKTKLRLLLLEGADPSGAPDLFSALQAAEPKAILPSTERSARPAEDEPLHAPHGPLAEAAAVPAQTRDSEPRTRTT